LLGGRASEEIFFDDISTGAENDIQEATRLPA
jgi:ATP-dependent Zn protease